ncbi:MAG: hypothetical protein KIT45_14025 [Fimbriimonadia bacterium]|nr:hypothetical protein [Fimbriimonadia bacterium]
MRRTSLILILLVVNGQVSLADWRLESRVAATVVSISQDPPADPPVEPPVEPPIEEPPADPPADDPQEPEDPSKTPEEKPAEKKDDGKTDTTPPPLERSLKRSSGWDWKHLLSPSHLKEEFQSKVTLSGRKTMGFHSHHVSGDFQAFRDQNYFGEGGKSFTDNTDLSVRVNKLFGLFSMDWRWTNSRFNNPYDARITWGYESKNFQMELGDITASLTGNDLVSFNRSLKGSSFMTKFGNGGRLKYISSQTRAAARTITVQGNDSAGPYYLQASQIVDGSERIRVDNVEKRRGEDYTIDYYSGILYFREGMIIPRISTIVVTYETYAFNSAGSRIDGWRFETPLARGVNVGFTSMQQTSRSGSSLRQRTEQFYGRGAPTTPYDLEFIPQSSVGFPIIILVAGAPQVEGTDYYFDPVLPYRFYFKRFIPSTLIVQVTYTPRPDPGSQFGGTRKVEGIDFTLPIGRYGGVSWNMARSALNDAGAKTTGTAQLMDARFELGRFSFNGVYRDIPTTFIGIESIGFRRNERGYQTDMGYAFNQQTQLRYSRNKARVASYTSTTSNPSANFTDTDIQSLIFNWTPQNGPSVTYSRSQNHADNLSVRSRQSSDNLRLSKTWNRLNTSLDFNQSKSVSDPRSSQLPRSVYNISSTRFSATWQASNQLSISGVSAISLIRDTGRKTNARDLSLNLSWQPTETIRATYSWRDSSSGNLFLTSNLNENRTRQVGGSQLTGSGGFQNGWGIGYNGNGFSSGAPSYGSFTSYGSQGKGQTLSLSWYPTQALSFEAQFNQNRASGDYQSNSDSKGLTFSASYAPRDWLSFTTSWTRQDVSFISSAGNSKNEYLSASVEIGPLRRWTFSGSLYAMKTSSLLGQDQFGDSGSYSQDPRGVAARITYAVGARQNLFVDWQTSEITGYLASRESLIYLGYEYRLTSNLSLIAAYRIRDQRNLDPEYQQYSYRSNSFDLNVGLQF